MASVEQECEISVAALTAGLRIRDLAVIEKFCEAVDHVFLSVQHRLDRAKRDSAKRDTFVVCYSGYRLQQFYTAIKMICDFCQECVAKSKFHSYAHAVIKMTLDCLTRNVKQVVTNLQMVQVAEFTNSDVKKQSDRLLTAMTDTIMELKSIAAKIPVPVQKRERHHSGTSVASERVDSMPISEGTMNEKQRQLIKIWGNFDTRAVIVEGILNNEIPLLMQYLGQRFDPEVADWTYIINTGLNETLIFLREKEMAYARKIIKNMGFDPDTKLRQICLYTLDRHLRDYLATELETNGSLSQDELSMLQFVHKLEELYPCQSFETAKALRVAEAERPHEPSCISRMKNESGQEGEIQLSKLCGDLQPHAGGDDKSRSSTFYSHTMLEWIRSYDDTTRQRIILAALFQSPELQKKSFQDCIPALVVWQFLNVHQDIQRLEAWIKSQFEEASEVKVLSWPYNLSITKEMIDSMTGATDVTKDKLLNLLARYGEFSLREATDFDSLLRRLRRIHSALGKGLNPSRRVEVSGIDLVEFHHQMIKFCLQKQQPQLLYFYLDYWALQVDTDSVKDLLLGGELPSWLHMIIDFRRAAKTLDPEAVFAASLACSVCVQQLNRQSIEAMFDQKLTLTALGTLMFSHQELNEFLAHVPESANHTIRALNCKTLTEAFLEEDQTPCCFTTVYEVMQGQMVFDPSNFFGWQAANSFITEDGVKEMPFFSKPKLVDQYSYKESLKWTYYLKQGRPSFAFCRLLIDEGITEPGITFAPQKFRRICMNIHWIGVKYFHQSHVTSACAALMEMIGQNSTLFRVHIQTANQITDYVCAEAKGNLEERKQYRVIVQKEMAGKLHQCLQNKTHVIQEVFHLLEDAVCSNFENHPHLCRTDQKAEERWVLVHAFCRAHGLRMSNKFLEFAASNNDWLTFLSYAQMYQFTIQQIRPLLKLFNNATIAEHLDNILNILQTKSRGKLEPVVSVDAGQFRAKLYSAVGVSKEPSSTDDEASTETELSPRRQPAIQADKQPNTTPVSGMAWESSERWDLLSLVRHCENQTETRPSQLLCQIAVHQRNPILAVIAACYNDSDPVSCACSWLRSILPVSSLPADTVASHGGLGELSLLGICALKSHNAHALYTAFQLFFPVSVVLAFLEFLSKLQKNFPEVHLKNLLLTFQSNWKKVTITNVMEDMKLFPISWLREVILESVRLHLCLDNQTRCFLKLLHQVNFMATLFPKEANVPNVTLLHQLALLTQDERLEMNMEALLDETKPCFQEECARALGALESRGLWGRAKVARELLKLPMVHLKIAQMNAELKSLQESDSWRIEEVRIEYWKKAEKMLAKDESNLVSIAKFFKDHAEQSQDPTEKQILYEISYKFLSKSSSDTHEQTSLFAHIWLSKIHAHMQKMQSSKEVLADLEETTSPSRPRSPFDRRQLKQLVALSRDSSSFEAAVQLSNEEKQSLEQLLCELLLAGQLTQAMRIATCFAYSNQDLNIILTCQKLASSLVLPDGLDAASRDLMKSPRFPGRRRQSSLHMVTLPRSGSSLSIVSRLSDAGDVLVGEEEGEDRVLGCLDLLTQQCRHGKQICQVILSNYQIAKLLEVEYTDTLAMDEFKLLAHVLSTDLRSRYLLAKSFIQSVALQDTQVAGFLCDSIIETLAQNFGMAGSSSTSSTTSASSGGRVKHLVISDLVQLCEDPALLGHRLLQASVSSKSSNPQPTLPMLQLETELLVVAHDCFTLACHMEGISQLLRVCRALAQRLHEAQQYNTLVNLLIGVGRYSEMTYIFHILKSQHQFELLFQKRTDKEEKLKQAVLDYLERYHSDDTETYSMMAVHFTMYRQIAAMLRSSADDMLKALSSTPIENSSTLQKKLEKILHYLTDAADSYVKEGCLRHAEECVKQARLVALQIQLLPARTRVITLDVSSLPTLLVRLNKVHHVHVVLDAYGEGKLWSVVFLHHLVKRGDFKMLRELTTYQQLTANLMSDIVDSFEKDQGLTNKQQLSNIQKLLGYCKDIRLVFSLACRLSLHEYCQQLLKSPSGAYLRDVNTLAAT